jgi:hypothetical protein
MEPSKNRKLIFPRKEGNYAIVLNKIKDGITITKFDHEGNDVTISNSSTSKKSNLYNLNEVLAALKNDYKIEE